MNDENSLLEQGSARILVVDDEAAAVRNMVHILRKEGYTVESTQSGPTALRLIAERDFDLVLTDLRMEKVDGMKVLQECVARRPDTAVIMTTGFATVSSAVDAMKEGAFHYIAKPYRIEEVRHLVGEALELVRLRRENRQLRHLVEEFGEARRIITQDPAMKRLIETARQIAPSDASVVIGGESGTGKELLANFIHLASRRRDRRFIAVNCGAFTEELLANELFGHEKGAFTGAVGEKPGLIEAADGGTLFLDEVTEMSPAMQAKLLRVIQEGELYRLGSTKPRQVDVRYLAATNRDLREAVATGRFRNDLYYRLNVVALHLPPLNDRAGDIPLLALFFLKHHATAMGKAVGEIAPEALEVLAGYDYPGNVRELSNLIERGVALAPGNCLELAQLPEEITRLQANTFRPQRDQLPTLEAQEEEYIRWVLQQTSGNRTRAAEILGIDRVSLWRKLKKFGVEG